MSTVWVIIGFLYESYDDTTWVHGVYSTKDMADAAYEAAYDAEEDYAEDGLMEPEEFTLL